MNRFLSESVGLFWGWEPRCFGIVHSVEWQFRSDISGQPMGPLFKGQAEWLPLEDKIDRLSRNVSNKLALYSA